MSRYQRLLKINQELREQLQAEIDKNFVASGQAVPQSPSEDEAYKAMLAAEKEYLARTARPWYAQEVQANPVNPLMVPRPDMGQFVYYSGFGNWTPENNS